VFRAKTNRVGKMTIKTAAASPAAAAMSNFNRSSIMMFSPSGKVLGLAGAAPLNGVKGCGLSLRSEGGVNSTTPMGRSTRTDGHMLGKK
jgi:ABC-type uncharacterized transport system permease subunit